MSVVDKVVSGGGRLLALSFLQRGGTFIMNMLVLRHLPTHVSGAGFSLELVLSTTFIIREGLRLASLRETGLVAHDNAKSSSTVPTALRQLINTSWICTALGLLCTIAAALFMAPRLYPIDAVDFPTFELSMWLYCLSAAIEFFTEPFYILAHTSLLFQLRVQAQGWGFFAKAVVQAVAVLVFNQGMLAFGLSQVAYAVVHGLVYLRYFVVEQRSSPSFPLADFAPHVPSGLSPTLMHFWQTLTFQSILKYLLTEGDRLVLSAFETPQQQGEYATAFNIGSLAPRLVFLPIEDASKAMFAKLLASNDAGASTTSSSTHDAKRLFELSLKFMSLCGLVFVFFGTNYTRTLLYLLAGYAKTLDQIPVVLSCYCVCVYFLALNGICEAFVYAVGNEAALQRLNKFLILFFVVTSASAIVLMHVCGLGSVGIVLANCVNMACRITYCLHYIHAYFVESSSSSSWLGLVRTSLPHPAVLSMMAVSWVVTFFSEQHFRGPSLVLHAMHVGVGGVLFLATAALLWRFERQFLRDILNVRRTKAE
ncbi:Aste57867_16397 [Aphanomyces stellatus]|uniref:Protein RFT1 homolog n=1 Tax=Aphanomyces stellatus TaxID=120398 RepID=A0A485L6B6_9STRA|nr:hypothetical protein As57867_016340 [Aphanomyces stellatus]VFT93172.1 Aste57867_16397 [Aphanomyces stellatus]